MVSNCHKNMAIGLKAMDRPELREDTLSSLAELITIGSDSWRCGR